MTSRPNFEQTYRTWSSPILLELKKREHQMAPVERQALENVLVERRLLDIGNPDGIERRQGKSHRVIDPAFESLIPLLDCGNIPPLFHGTQGTRHQ